MKGLLCFASVCMIALAASGSAQESKKQPAKGEITKAVFFVPNQHWPACATALEGSMKQVEGIRSATVNFPNKIATVEFDESEISAQEVSRAAFQAPHMMGKDMKYGAFLMLSVPDAKNKAAGAKATAVLEKVKGVEKAVFFPQTKSVAVQFASKGKVTSGELIQALEDTGLKADQYGAKIKKWPAAMPEARYSVSRRGCTLERVRSRWFVRLFLAIASRWQLLSLASRGQF